MVEDRGQALDAAGRRRHMENGSIEVRMLEEQVDQVEGAAGEGIDGLTDKRRRQRDAETVRRREGDRKN
jgi:hypothetical protein